MTIKSSRPVTENRCCINYRTYVLAIFFMVAMLNTTDAFLFGLLMEPIKQDLALSDAWMGFLAGLIFSISSSLAGIPVAYWADRGNRRSIVAGGLFFWSLLTIMCGTAQNTIQMALARIGVGITQVTGGAPSHALLSDYFPPQQRGMALGTMATGGTLGIFLAMLIGGWIAEYYGWRVAFLVAGLPGIILAILVRATIKEPLRGQYDTAELSKNTPSAWTTLRFLFGLRCYRHMVIAGSLQSFAGIGAAVWSTAFLMRTHDMSIGVAGTTLALLDTAFAALGIILWGVVADRLGRRDSRWYQWIPALGTLLSLPFYLLFLMLPNTDAASVFLAPSVLFFAAWIAPSHALAQSLAKPQMRAMSSAAMLLVQSLIGMGLGPLAVGVLNDALSSRFGDEAIRYSLVIVTLVSIWGAMHNLISAQALRQDLNAQTP